MPRKTKGSPKAEADPKTGPHKARDGETAKVYPSPSESDLRVKQLFDSIMTRKNWPIS